MADSLVMNILIEFCCSVTYVLQFICCEHIFRRYRLGAAPSCTCNGILWNSYQYQFSGHSLSDLLIMVFNNKIIGSGLKYLIPGYFSPYKIPERIGLALPCQVKPVGRNCRKVGKGRYIGYIDKRPV